MLEWRTHELLCCAHICNANAAQAITSNKYIVEAKAINNNEHYPVWLQCCISVQTDVCLEVNTLCCCFDGSAWGVTLNRIV